MLEKKKIAIVYDWIDKWGGVERVLLTLHEMFPQAEFYTSYFDPENAPWAKELKIKTSFIEKLPEFIKKSRIISLPLYPYAFESFNLKQYDLVISVTSAFAKSVLTRPETKHICYLLTPTRFLWGSTEIYLKNKILRTIISPYLAKLREWDYICAQRPDSIISISKTVAGRCRKFYRRESDLIYPPFDVDYWQNIKNQKSKIKTTNQIAKIIKDTKFYLVVSRLEPYKRVDLAVQSINRLYNYRLIVVGEGRESKALKRMAKDNIHFFSKLTDEELAALYSYAEALIMPQEEDFGYVSLEAQFFGCPVIAYKKGGATETVIAGKTGIFFEKQSENSLIEELNKFDMIQYKLKQTVKKFGQKNVKRFSKEKFIKQFSRHFDPPVDGEKSSEGTSDVPKRNFYASFGR